MKETTLNLINPGKKAKIIQIKGEGSARRRLLDMGMIPGAELEVIKRAPLGDPIEFKIKGYHLTLRKNEAEHILVQQLG
ncbi:MAG: ferrous iron transport protein A [Candidatus Thermoplasmatota archaeon]|nr:ferrous iron transport protein A [Candidatus Thermoplasmatota archaeon]